MAKFSFHEQPAELKHGSVVIAAITSCTNTSNPSVMLGAGLVAKKACELGLQVSLILEICFSVHFCCLLDISMWSSCNQLVTWLILHQYHFVAGLFSFEL